MRHASFQASFSQNENCIGWNAVCPYWRGKCRLVSSVTYSTIYYGENAFPFATYIKIDAFGCELQNQEKEKEACLKDLLEFNQTEPGMRFKKYI